LLAALRIGAVVLFAEATLGGAARAQTSKTFINYFQPAPVTCTLTTNAWGCTATGSTPNCVSGMGVVPRDTCNGIESSTNPPAYYYWDGTIILAPDGTYHLFASRWAGSQGFNPGWQGSDPIHAVGGKSALGPYTDKGYVYNNSSFGSDPHHGHNTQVVTLLNGTYALIVSEVVPFTIFTATSLDGPWTPCSGSPGSGLTVPSGFGGNTSYASNVSLVVRPDGNFEITQRHGLLALSTTGICGPYKAQQPTNTYPSNEAIPSQYSASIYPNRQKHSDAMGPSTVESTYTVAEDPVIWFSGGQYHVLYDYPGDRVGYHLTSTDGIHNWTDQGLAYDPRYAQQIFSYTDGTIDHWYKMERPSVLVENGLITHVTFAVADVNKDNQIPAGSNHGSKVIVVPFDGVAFEKDTGVSGTGGTGGTGAGGAGGKAGAGAGGGGGNAGTGGAGAGGGKAGTGGAGGGGGGKAGGGGTGGAAGASGGRGGSGAGGTSGTGGVTATGGSNGRGGNGSGDNGGNGGSTGTGGDAAGGTTGTGGGAVGSGGAAGISGSGGTAATGSGGTTGGNETGGGGGCSCALASRPSRDYAPSALFLALAIFGGARRRRRTATTRHPANSGAGNSA
jgi:hypothetical protein